MSVNPLAPGWLRHPDDANALAARVWPRTARRDAAGGIELGGVSATELAARFGTPVFVVDEADARARAESVRAAFDREFGRIGAAATVYYAGKAFLCTEVVRWVLAAGLNIDVASGGELAVALAGGADAARLGFHGNNKSRAELERAIGAGIGSIVVDSVGEIDLVAEIAARHGRRQPVRVRVNSGVHAHTHEFLATAREDQKFGIPLGETIAAVRRIRSFDSLALRGLHAHIGSQIFDVHGFAESARRLLALHAQLLAEGPVPELNLGGGFGIAYTEADDAMDLDHVAARLADIVAAECAGLGIPVPAIAVEPGRAIIGPTTATLYEVGTVKAVVVTDAESRSDHERVEPAEPSVPVGGAAVRTYVSVDGGMSDNIRPALYGAEYSVRLASRSSDADPALVRVVGKHCESGDIVVHADYLPGDIRSGDLLAVPATGAYCWSLSNNYNYLARPPVVAVLDGAARVLVRGETEEDLLARDMGVGSA